MDDGFEPAVGRGSEGYALPERRPITECEHLRAGEAHPDGPPQLSGGEHGEEHVILRPESGAEGAAHEGREHAQGVLGILEDTAEIALDVLHTLRLVVHGETAVFVGDHGGCEKLHRIVVLNRHPELGLHLHRRSPPCSLGMPT